MVKVLAGEVARGAGRRGPCRPAFERTGGPAPTPSEIGWHRCRAAPAHFACLAPRRAPRVFDGPDEDARRCVRERTELLSDRVGLTNRIGAVLATLGVNDYNPLLQSRRRRLAELRTGLDEPIPPNALAKIERLLARLELVLAQIAELERERDEVAAADAPDRAGKMIQQLTSLRGIGVQSATVLVREAFVRHFPNGKALGSYAGLTSTPYSSGGIDREQGIGKAGNRRLRTVMVELAWLWQRYQPGAAQVAWFRDRVGSIGRRIRKVMVVALARKLLIALWRFVIDGVMPEGAVMKPSI